MKIYSKIAKYAAIVLFIWTPQVYGQSNDNLSPKWRPFVRNFSPNEYSAGAQNWGAVQDERGIIYFANQQGVLQFDGINWKLIPILDGRTAFALVQDTKSTIWCGTQNDMGFLAPDSIGELKYISIANELPDTIKPIGKIRWINILEDQIFFLSSKYLIRKNQNNIKVWKASSTFYRQHVFNNKLHVYESRIGLKELKGDSLIISKSIENIENDPPTSIFSYAPNKLFISAWNSGLYKKDGKIVQKFTTEIDDEITNNPIIEAHYISPSKFILAGFNGGSYLLNNDGKYLNRFDKSTGLINELCNRIFVDKTNSLWLCNNYGLSRIEPFSPFTFFGESEGIVGSINDIIKFNNKLYVATDDKVYFQSSENKFKIKSRLELCWDLLAINDEILGAANYGVYVFDEDKTRLIILDQKKCFSLFRSKVDTNVVYVGTEEGLSTLKYENNQWEYQGRIEGITDEIRQIMEMPDGDLWLGTLGKGIIRYFPNRVEDNIRKYSIDDGLFDLKYYKISIIDEEPYFISPYSPVLKYNEISDSFSPDTKIFSRDKFISKIVQDKEGDIWFLVNMPSHNKIGFGELSENGNYIFNDKIFNRINSWDAKVIFPDSGGVTWIGHQFGLIKYEEDNKTKINEPFPTIISSVRQNNIKVFGGVKSNNSKKSLDEIEYKNNNIRFEFSLASFEDKDAIQFQYYLDDYEDTWSQWTEETKKDYTNLFEGEYVFHVRGRDIYGSISAEDVYSFIVLPPWYRSTTAYILYFISLVLFIFAVDRIRKSQINKKNKIEEERKLKQQAAIDKAKSDERQMVRRKTAADFHDELGHMLTKITLFTEMAKRSTKGNIGAQKYLEGVGNNASQLSSGMKDLIWTLDSDKDSLYDALIRIKDFGDVLFEHSSISFGTTGFPEELNRIKISMDMRRHLILIFKEVMNNCLKYSNCHNAEFSVIYKNDIIQIIFNDDGEGFDLESANNGNGIKNIRMRAKSMGSQVNIKSEMGKTEVILTMKI